MFDGARNAQCLTRPWKNRMRKLMSTRLKFTSGNARGAFPLRVPMLAALVLCGLMIANAAPAYCFPWSIDMFRGQAVHPLAVAPRVMPEGTLPVDGIHYNIHYGQPKDIATDQALPPMKLEAMTIKLKNPLQPTPENLSHGQELFESTCSPCHGIGGKGDGSVVHLLQHKPANLMTGITKNLPDGYIYGYIRDGGIWMPSYDDAMTSNERWQVVVYLRNLQSKYGEKTASADTGK